MALTDIWGVNTEIGIPEIAARAAVMFLLMIAMIRVGGMRSLGKGSLIDNILTVLLGAILARGIVGATPFLSAVAGGIVITAVHNIFSNLSFRWHQVGKLVKGNHLLLYRNGEYISQNMDKVNISRHDVEEQMRLKLHQSAFDGIEAIYFERTGELSFIKSKDSENSAEVS
ncbi:MAG TPA: YetF domain-containing protein [Flavisolibacter sp.]|nr:YetF domain-containing protein [Flavisolibacter sp.]